MGIAARARIIGGLLLGLVGCFQSSLVDDATPDAADGDAGALDAGPGDAPEPIDLCASDDPNVRSLCALTFWDACIPLRLERGSRVARLEAFVETRECLIRAGHDCRAVDVCIGRRVEPSTEPCTEHCEGDTRVRCDGTSRIYEDCTQTLPGNQCLPGAFGRVVCATAECIDQLFRCDENEDIEACFDGVDRFVLHCIGDSFCDYNAIDRGFLECTGRGPSCRDNRCESPSRMIPCMNGQEGPPIDCGQGQACGSSGICDYEPALCMPYGSTLTCDGADLVYCRVGAPHARVSCTQLGFSSCVPGESRMPAGCR